MPLMQWSPRMSVGVGQCDDEHKVLVSLVNELFDAIAAGKGSTVLGDVLDRLVKYTVTHFEHEEKLMRQHGFPGLAEHQAQHKALAEQAVAIQKKHAAGATGALSMEVMNFLKNWLIGHIGGTDAKYGVFLNAKGIH